LLRVRIPVQLCGVCPGLSRREEQYKAEYQHCFHADHAQDLHLWKILDGESQITGTLTKHYEEKVGRFFHHQSHTKG
jgi:hypothetical protein